MMILGHRTRVAIFAILFALLALMLLTRPTHAAWGVEPVEVHATLARCPLVSAAPDGAHGALVVWQQNTANGGLLLARRLLASGDVDATWDAPILLSTQDVARTALGSVSDDAGGAYVWWMEGTKLYLTRLAAQGVVAAGWPARGRLLDMLVDSGSRPVVCADGTGGVYAAWLTMSGLLPAYIVIRAHHLGPANDAKDGWPSGGRALAGTQALGENATTFGIATAVDGGLWLAYGSTVLDVENAGFAPGEVRVARHDAAGLPAAGWTASGVALAPFRGDLLATSSLWGLAPRMRLAAVSDDGSGGAFVLFGSVIADNLDLVRVSGRLQRVQASGAIAPGWPEGGVGQPLLETLASDGGAAETSFQLHSDLRGGVYVGQPLFYDHGTGFSFQRISGAGTGLGDLFGVSSTGLESSPRGDGGVVAASYFPYGPYGPFEPSAYLLVDQSDPGASFNEAHPDPVVEWYGDIGLAATGDGGSIFAWSQVRERFGVFAIRLNPDGLVTGVPPGGTPRGLRVWYARGSGVRVAGETGPMTLALHDLTGREVARGESADAGEWTVPGTAALPSGMYFAKAVADGQVLRTKVVVIR